MLITHYKTCNTCITIFIQFLIPEQKALKTAKENTFLTTHSETTILRHINKTGPVKFPSGDRENVVLKEPSTGSTESLSQPELEMEDPEISNMAFNSVSVLLRGFGVDLQKHLKVFCDVCNLQMYYKIELITFFKV